MPRQPRLDCPGLLHHVIFRGIEKCNIVKDDNDRQDFVARLQRLAVECNVEIYAWALLDNHAHLLVRSGNYGLPRFMRRLLTSHAINFNLRYQRHGHLFQNRYKSIVCEEDSYFLELVRYIHLNPIRAGIIKSIEELNCYPWCGHGALINPQQKNWQNTYEVLRYFSGKKRQAVKAYERFIIDGLNQGERPELVGGGLRRSQALLPDAEDPPAIHDARILGNGSFVEQILQQGTTEALLVNQQQQQEQGEAFVIFNCKKESVKLQELQSGSRRKIASQLRKNMAIALVEEYGWTIGAAAKHLGVSISAICKILSRNR